MMTFNVAGMTCGHCVKAVTEAVRDLDPAAEVQVDLATGTVRVNSETAEPGAVSEAIRDAGYDEVSVAG
ncbi:heavy-metal-associated domain-containing protein [Terrihabitans rhizophilus]|uniref:Cation transporter n=1 Tax=Terrihabitans rhizophilus TaxID=3092662 RepID=A0ABU4RLY5_9HYPH|nr:cation transporter [Terrihabitans sp. PJ23]MDX6805838.1 cation transporter [Terrihabitans sp. PJ23]